MDLSASLNAKLPPESRFKTNTALNDDREAAAQASSSQNSNLSPTALKTVMGWLKGAHAGDAVAARDAGGDAAGSGEIPLGPSMGRISGLSSTGEPLDRVESGRSQATIGSLVPGESAGGGSSSPGSGGRGGGSFGRRSSAAAAGGSPRQMSRLGSASTPSAPPCQAAINFAGVFST